MNDSQMKDGLKKIRDAHPDWSFRQAWDQLKKDKPELFANSLRPVAPDNVPGPYAHPAGTDAPDERAIPRFKNYDQRSRDARIVRSDAQKMLKERVQLVQAANPNLSFRDAWGVVKRDNFLLAKVAVVEAVYP